MKKLFCLLLSILAITFLSSFLGFLFGSSISTKRKMAFKICRNLGTKLEKKYGLEFLGISEAAPDGKYKCIGLELEYRKKILSKDEGRILLLNCVYDAIECFNSYPEFLQYVEDGSFTIKNLSIDIFVHPKGNHDVYYPNIGIFTFLGDILWYRLRGHGEEYTYRYFAEEEETYDEAIKIARSQYAEAQL